VSDVLFAPSEEAVAQLAHEGVDPARVHLVGNTMIDSLQRSLPAARGRRVAAGLGITGPYVVATLHRPSNVDVPAILDGLLGVLGELAHRLPVVLPAHPRLQERLAGRAPDGVQVVGALGYLDFLGLLDGAALAVTDSGGVQEETTVLGVPCITVRTTTERAVTATEGSNQVVGTEPTAVLAAAHDSLTRPRPGTAAPVGWDGQAAERIADVLAG